MMLHTTLVASLIYGGANLILFHVNTYPLAITAPVFIITLITILLARVGAFVFATHFFLHGTWLVLTYTSFIYLGGILSPILYFFLLTIIVSGLLLGAKTSRYYSTLVLITLSGLYATGNTNAFPANQLLSPGQYYIFAIVFTILTTLLVEIILKYFTATIQDTTQGIHDQEQTNRQFRSSQQDIKAGFQEHNLEIESQKLYYESLFRYSPMAIVVLDMKMKVTSCNTAFEMLFGHTLEEVLGKNLDELIAPNQYRDQANRYTQTVLKGEKVNCNVVREHKDGSQIDLEMFGVPVILDGQQIGVLAIYKDISERKRNEERLEYLANHDFLTGLPNRSLFQDRLQHALNHAKRKQKSLGVLFVDLDDFKLVNDTYGHEIGDAVLRIVSQRLSSLLRASDTVARLGGDEFAFILEGNPKQADIQKIAGKIFKVLKAPIRFKNHTITVSASIGMGLFPQDGASPDDLMRKADHGMYAAKTQHVHFINRDETIYQ
ncbi:MAG: diguanylate cyclase [Anaerolineales bacterium]